MKTCAAFFYKVHPHVYIAESAEPHQSLRFAEIQIIGSQYPPSHVPLLQLFESLKKRHYASLGDEGDAYEKLVAPFQFLFDGSDDFSSFLVIVGYELRPVARLRILAVVYECRMKSCLHLLEFLIHAASFAVCGIMSAVDSF